MTNKLDFLKKISLDDLIEMDEELSHISDDLTPEERDKFDVIHSILEKVNQGGAIQEAIRDTIFEIVKSTYNDLDCEDLNTQDVISAEDKIESKRKELYEILENLDQYIDGKDVQETTAFFSSLLDIQSQLFVQKTEGVITVKTRLYQFFDISDMDNIRPELKQEIPMIFAPEEISAMRKRLPELASNDETQNFFTMVLDQAYDVNNYNEASGHLLLEMTRFFLKKLKEIGLDKHPSVLDFDERHQRSKASFANALEDLREVENIIQKHLEKHPVLLRLPRMLRDLILIKLGLNTQDKPQTILKDIQSVLTDYSRVRNAVIFDFNRLPSYQQGIRIRQSVILNLQKDVLKFSGENMENELKAVQEELNQLLDSIESQSETLNPNSPEYQELLKRKQRLQQDIEIKRKKLNVINSQHRLVDIQHSLISESIKRYQKNEALQEKIEEDLKKQAIKKKIEPKTISPQKTREPNRMVMARRKK